MDSFVLTHPTSTLFRDRLLGWYQWDMVCVCENYVPTVVRRVQIYQVKTSKYYNLDYSISGIDCCSSIAILSQWDLPRLRA